MQSETQHKGIAGAISGLIIALIPVLTSLFTGTDVAPDQLSSLGDALHLVAVAAAGLAVGWLTVYLAPRNRPIGEE